VLALIAPKPDVPSAKARRDKQQLQQQKHQRTDENGKQEKRDMAQQASSW
jgi:hypothetical protein